MMMTHASHGGKRYKDLFQVCSAREIEEFLGNSMHLLACEAFVLWALAGLEAKQQQHQHSHLDSAVSS